MGMQTKLVLMATTAALAAWSAPHVARACSNRLPCQERPTLALVGDVTSRPLNACIGVQYTAVLWDRETLTTPVLAYVAADGTRIMLAATDTLRVYCPTEPLAPDTDYVLVGPEIDTSFGMCGRTTEVELLAFHTGTALDTVPPSAPGLVEDTRCRHAICRDGGCCGPYETVEHHSSWDAATDDGAEVAYVIDGELRTWTTRLWSNGGHRGSFLPWPYELPPRDVRAIDVAGNIGEAAMHGEPCVPAPIEPDAGPPDAFTSSTPDAAIETLPDASVPSGAGGGGCSIVSSERRVSGALVLWVTLALLARDRRRRGTRARRGARDA